MVTVKEIRRLSRSLKRRHDIHQINYTDLLGKDFEYGERGPDTYDCYGLAIEIFKRYGISIPDYGFAKDKKDIHKMIEEFSRGWEKAIFPLHPCIVAFFIHKPFVSHIGVVIGQDKFIHILDKSKVTVERLSAIEWKNKIAGYYQWQN